MSEIEESRRRGRPVVRWKDKVKEQMNKKELLIEGEGLNKQRGCVQIGVHLLWPSPWGDISKRNEPLETIDR